MALFARVHGVRSRSADAGFRSVPHSTERHLGEHSSRRDSNREATRAVREHIEPTTLLAGQGGQSARDKISLAPRMRAAFARSTGALRATSNALARRARA